MSKTDKKAKAEEITVWVCPTCHNWQRWPGPCDSLCSQNTERATYTLASPKER